MCWIPDEYSGLDQNRYFNSNSFLIVTRLYTKLEKEKTNRNGNKLVLYIARPPQPLPDKSYVSSGNIKANQAR